MKRLAVLAVGAIALIALGFVAGRWIVGPSAPVPSAPVSPGGAVASAANNSRFGLPDPAHTPGSINPAVTQENLQTTVCMPGWAQKVRPPAAYTSALKVAQILEYGYADRSPSHYQEDHLVPLELGGAPRDPRNLWPEPNEILLEDGTTIGSGEKDDLEDHLHRRVCAGTMNLSDAQRLIAGNWIEAWKVEGQP